METVNPKNRVLAAITLLVLVGWAWALSNVGMPDAVWVVNAALTLALVALLVAFAIRRIARR